MREDEKPWQPMSVAAIAELLQDADFPWWIAGGYALELAIGKNYRAHGGIDVLILRPDHTRVRQYLQHWDCWAADPPGTLRFWPAGESLKPYVHDIWCRQNPADTWRWQIMIDETDERGWCSRRNPDVSMSFEDMTRTTQQGVPYLAPHVQLYYKALRRRAKDERDFDEVLASGVQLDRDWLIDVIRTNYGPDHPWLDRLEAV